MLVSLEKESGELAIISAFLVPHISLPIYQLYFLSDI